VAAGYPGYNRILGLYEYKHWGVFIYLPFFMLQLYYTIGNAEIRISDVTGQGSTKVRNNTKTMDIDNVRVLGQGVYVVIENNNVVYAG